MESIDGECSWMHSPGEHPWAMSIGQARKLTRLGSEGCWTEKVKIVNCRALTFFLQCKGCQGIDYKCFKTDVPHVQSVLGIL